jgi:hypothetical protein
MLFWESKLIHKLRGKTFVPFLHFVGDEKTEDKKMYHVMVMDLLGKSLEDLFQECRRKFDLKTCLHIATQMVSLYNSNLPTLSNWVLWHLIIPSTKMVVDLLLCAQNGFSLLESVHECYFRVFADRPYSKGPRREDYSSRYKT